MNHGTHGIHGKIEYEAETYAIRGAIFEVYREMGCGFLEAVYQECLEREFHNRKILFEAQKELQLKYKGTALKQIYKPDFICYGKIIVELKAVKTLSDEHRSVAQLFESDRAESRIVSQLWTLSKSYD